MLYYFLNMMYFIFSDRPITSYHVGATSTQAVHSRYILKRMDQGSAVF